MSISPRLLRKLQETPGADAAEDLVSLIESMDANRGDVAGLRHEMRLGFAQSNAALEETLREQTRFFFVAWSVLLAAIVGLYAR